MSDAKKPPLLQGDAAEQAMRRMTRRSFVTGGLAALAGFGAWRWLRNASSEGGLPWPLRRALQFNQGLGEALFSSDRLAPTFPKGSIRGSGRTNGDIGLTGEVAAAGWKIRVQHAGRDGEQSFRLQDLQKLSRMELVTELKCVEGWGEVMQFGGVSFRDFVTRFGLATKSGRAPDPEGNPQDLYRFVYLATPKEDYYVGLDMAGALHPQTMLCDTMNGQPLIRLHGAPLRLYLAVKYGYKSLKRVSLIRFQDERPRDYWAEQGYDWYAGL
jgi:DMSO/TMAO reductase YedYZ molybdopterin-dependent catalytic subunit